MDGKVVIGIDLETKGFDLQIKATKDKLEQLQEEYMTLKNAKSFEGQEGELRKLQEEIEKTRNKYSDLIRKQRESETAGASKMVGSLKEIGKGVESNIRKVAKWTLAVFGIRTAYNAVRNAMSVITNNDAQLKADIDYMKNALAYSLEPVVRAIVDLAKKLMVYIAYIVKALTGKNIFENANKSLKNSVGSAKKLNKELNKTIAGFDEMNVLQDNTSSGASGGGTTNPSFNLEEAANIEPPKWLETTTKLSKKLWPLLVGLVSALKLIKKGIKGVKALGIGLAITGVIIAIKSLIEFIKDPSFDSFLGILKGIGLAVAGVAIAVGAWPVAIGAAVAEVVILIVKYFDKIKAIFNKAIEWLDTKFLGALRYLFGPIGDILYAPIKFVVEMGKGAFESFFGGIKKVIEGIVKLFQGDFLGGIKTIFGGLLDILLAPFKGLVSGIKGLWGQIKSSVSYWVEQFGIKFGEIKDKMLAPIKSFIDKVKNLWNDIKDAIKELANNIKEAIEGAFDIGKNTINKFVNKVKSIFGASGLIYYGSYGEGRSSGGGGRAKGGLYYPTKLPKLAVGGIVNRPGAGIPYHGATIGERGAEAVVPLTDSQQMALLGEAIGKYITVNANIVNTMNGRVISRELQKVQNDSDFAYNR